MVTPWGLPIVPIVWESIVLDDPPTPARTGLLLFIPVYPHTLREQRAREQQTHTGLSKNFQGVSAANIFQKINKKSFLC